jgi:hypothetical protein
MTGTRIFLVKLKARPAAALAGLAFDYATYAAMVLFLVLVWTFRWPLWLLERLTRRAVRKAVIDIVAKLSHG